MRPVSDRRQARQRTLLTGWAVSAVLLIVGVLMLLLTSATVPGAVVFVAGAIGSVVVTVGLLRARAALRDRES